jgi:hypothetical protein
MAGLMVRAAGVAAAVAAAVAGALAIIGTVLDERTPWLPVLGIAMALAGFVIIVASPR